MILRKINTSSWTGYQVITRKGGTKIRAFSGSAAGVFLAGCASLHSSVETPDAAFGDGLVYRMPMRQIQVSITMPKDASPAAPANQTGNNAQDKTNPSSNGSGQPGQANPPAAPGGQNTPANTGGNTPTTPNTQPQNQGTGSNSGNVNTVNTSNQQSASSPQSTIVTVQAGPAYPDMSTRFILKYGPNLVGTNKMNIIINEKGLLSSAGADTTSGVTEFLTSLAQAAGTNKASLAAPIKEQPKCKAGETYTVSLDPTKAGELNTQLCEYKINGELLFKNGSSANTTLSPGKNSSRVSPGTGTQTAGLFYRQSLPYKITVSDEGAPENKREFIVFSPSEAPIGFMPISRSFFANNSAKLTFSDGMPTGYEQSMDGELVALAKLPASVLSAYFAAIGETFAAFKKNASSEKEYLDTVNQLAVSQLRNENCKEAVNAQKTDEEILAACTTE